nr:hypothetical protein [Candidatus Gracilibacteria bacterium]
MNQKTHLHHNQKNNSVDVKTENWLIKIFGLTFAKLVEIVGEYKANQFLNEYREALALWEEYTRDTKNRIIVTLDGRDTAGKGSNIKRVTYDLPNARFKVQAFGKPDIEERFEYNWFDRYKKYFPGEKGGITFFDRSWYNRAGVEAAMGFCTEEEYNWFMTHVNQFEKDDIIDEGIKFVKVYLSIKKEVQKDRLKRRSEKIRKRHKISHIDQQAQEKWNYYTLAKAKILELTDDPSWLVLDSNERFLSVVEIIKAIINTSDEVASLVSNELSIDLSPNPKIARTSMQELKLMEKRGDLERMKKSFNFKQ